MCKGQDFQRTDILTRSQPVWFEANCADDMNMDCDLQPITVNYVTDFLATCVYVLARALEGCTGAQKKNNKRN